MQPRHFKRLSCSRISFYVLFLLAFASNAWAVEGDLAGANTARTNSAGDVVDYVRQIKPLFAKHCFACHGALQQKSGLRLDTAELIRKGGHQGTAIVPGKPDESLLIDALTGEGAASQMPPEGEGTPLTAAELELVRRWITQGATSPADEQPQADPRQFWSYQPPIKTPLPAVRNAAWGLNPIDTFIGAEHDKRKLTPRPPAEKAVWLRRVYLDLIGIPPTREEFQAFLRDESPTAYEKVVDGLLERPQYGERWGRHWMDVWRYSDWYGSRGINEIRYSQRHIWRWRDWIVESLNRDKGYDQMVVEMLAGDELAPADPDVLRATGFLGRNWYKFDRNVWMFDTVEHSSQAFLGLTLKCCRCHDHKYDPISQEDYYHYRAFFEPHDVRIDRVSAATETEKDATLGMVLKDGVSRVYDKTLDAKTYVFQRGDDRSPDLKRVMEPAVPVALGHLDSAVQSVALPGAAYYPALQPAIAEGLITQAKAKITTAEHEIAKAKETAAAAAAKLEQFQQLQKSATADSGHSASGSNLFHDDFSQARPDSWKIVNGEWVYENGHLTQKSIGGFLTLVSKIKLPQDFALKLRYRVLDPGTLRSIGLSFDYVDGGNSQDVYTHLNDASQGIQAFHRTGGNQVYPATGIVKTNGLIKLGEITTVEIIARGQNLILILNGVQQLDYVMPVPRQPGLFALWCHMGSAEFHELEIRELVPTLADLKRSHQTALDTLALNEQRHHTAVKELESLQSRLDAERAKFTNQPAESVQALSLSASRSERTVAVSVAQESVLQAEQYLNRIRESAKLLSPVNDLDAKNSPPTKDVAAEKPMAEVEANQKLEMAKLALTTAQKAAETLDGKYTPLGEQFPNTSTGRRLALARWITHRQNPRAARVAVNHMWLRHFGQALVPTVANFGLNGELPSHPELLDWLAVELMEQGWRMKPLHRLIVLSNTYRLSSASGPNETGESTDKQNRLIDSENKYLWRMNSRRMEAEAVRDSVLSIARSLDTRLGGPEIPEKEGHTNHRRSLYFRLTPNEKMKFLEVFDAVDPNACYRRRESVVPNQALALMNSSLALDQARLLAETLTRETGAADDDPTNTAFIKAAFEQVLTHVPSQDEVAACQKFLRQNTALVQDLKQTAFPAGGQSTRAPSPRPSQRARENLVHVLLSHNAFVTIR